MQLGRSVLIFIEKVNKNYELRNERLYRCAILNNHSFRKKVPTQRKIRHLVRILQLSPTCKGQLIFELRITA
jgi:hypothetical protein